MFIFLLFRKLTILGSGDSLLDVKRLFFKRAILFQTVLLICIYIGVLLSWTFALDTSHEGAGWGTAGAWLAWHVLSIPLGFIFLEGGITYVIHIFSLGVVQLRYGNDDTNLFPFKKQYGIAFIILALLLPWIYWKGVFQAFLMPYKPDTVTINILFPELGIFVLFAISLFVLSIIGFRNSPIVKAEKEEQKSESNENEKATVNNPPENNDDETTEGRRYGVLGLVFAVLSLITLPIIFGPLAVIFGIIAVLKDDVKLGVTAIVLGVLLAVISTVIANILLSG